MSQKIAEDQQTLLLIGFHHEHLYLKTKFLEIQHLIIFDLFVMQVLNFKQLLVPTKTLSLYKSILEINKCAN